MEHFLCGEEPMKRKSKKFQMPPRGAQPQRPKSWSKREEQQDPRRQRKRRRLTIFLEDYCMPV